MIMTGAGAFNVYYRKIGLELESYLSLGVDVWPVVTSFTIDGGEHKY